MRATWASMVARCHSERNPGFKNYGARGISVCSRWRYGEGEKSGFQCFMDDMGPKPSPELSIDRIDNGRLRKIQLSLGELETAGGQSATIYIPATATTSPF
jgi:hypothetical protein